MILLGNEDGDSEPGQAYIQGLACVSPSELHLQAASQPCSLRAPGEVLGWNLIGLA
jgi:hypothetical protein